MDEARRHHINDRHPYALSRFGYPCSGDFCTYQRRYPDLLFAIEEVVSGKFQTKKQTYIDLPKENAEAIAELQSALSELNPELPNTRLACYATH